MDNDDLPRTPEGYVSLSATGVFLKDDELIVLGNPPEDDEEAEFHNCDYMGCAVEHVLCRAIVAVGRTDGKRTRIETLQARVEELESAKLTITMDAGHEWTTSQQALAADIRAYGEQCAAQVREVLQAALDTAVKCGDAQRDRIAELEKQLGLHPSIETDSADQCFDRKLSGDPTHLTDEEKAAGLDGK